MELQIFSNNMDITPRLRDYVEKKTARLDRYLPNLSSIQVELAPQLGCCLAQWKKRRLHKFPRRL